MKVYFGHTIDCKPIQDKRESQRVHGKKIAKPVNYYPFERFFGPMV